MTMLERGQRERAETGGRLESRRRFMRLRGRDAKIQDAPPPSAGPDEETVRIVPADLRKRRQRGRWRRGRRWVIALVVAALLAGCAWLVLFSSLVTAERVEVTGTSTIKDARIERAADVSTGTPLARIDLDAVRSRVEAITSVRRVKVSRSWPHTVHIAVTERTPIAVIDQGDGLQGLDADGVLFGTYRAKPTRLPLVVSARDTSHEALVETGRVLSSLPANVAARVQLVQVASVDEIRLVLNNGRKVLWGSAEGSAQKAEVLVVLLKRPGQQIDVSVPSRPTTK